MLILDRSAHINFLIFLKQHLLGFYQHRSIVKSVVEAHISSPCLLIDQHICEGCHIPVVTLLQCADRLKKFESGWRECDNSRLWHSVVLVVALDLGQPTRVNNHDLLVSRSGVEMV